MEKERRRIRKENLKPQRENRRNAEKGKRTGKPGGHGQKGEIKGKISIEGHHSSAGVKAGLKRTEGPKVQTGDIWTERADPSKGKSKWEKQPDEQSAGARKEQVQTPWKVALDENQVILKVLEGIPDHGGGVQKNKRNWVSSLVWGQSLRSTIFIERLRRRNE